FLKLWILGSALKEVHKCTVQIAKSLLQGNRGHITEPTIFFLEFSQHGRERIICKILTSLGIGSFTGRKCPIVHEATASERLHKNMLLSIGRIEPILIRPLRFPHYFFPFHYYR